MHENDEKRKQKQEEIKSIMLRYRDEHGNIDSRRFRLENPRIYARIPYYFETIDNALQACTGSSETAINVPRGGSVNRQTLRNLLAYDMIKHLRKKGYTLEEIGSHYGYTRAHVNQLLQALQQSMPQDDNENDAGLLDK